MKRIAQSRNVREQTAQFRNEASMGCIHFFHLAFYIPAFAGCSSTKRSSKGILSLLRNDKSISKILASSEWILLRPWTASDTAARDRAVHGGSAFGMVCKVL